jgi:competence protein ComEA
MGGNMLKIVVFVLLMCMGCSGNEVEEISLQETESIDMQMEDKEDSIFVYVCGAVSVPGVYELENGSRVFEAIEAAGGVLPEAAEETINQAQVLKDETKLYIPTQEEIKVQSSAASGKVNLNTATKEVLMTIPGVGASKAEDIISYRNKHGAFTKIEDVMKISGIKEALFEKMKEYITV